MGKHILLINDLPGYGKVALAAMIPVLSHMGHHIYNLPTALVSNTLDYGSFDILGTTDYMIKTIDIWEKLEFKFDAVSTGFIVSERQAEIVSRFCENQKRKGACIFMDPIMGDEGRLYNGIGEKTISHMRRIMQSADYIVPNYTEAAYLAGMDYSEIGMNKKQSDELIERLLQAGAKSIVVTSAIVDGSDCVIVHDYKNAKTAYLPFTSLPVRFPGTGDIFSAVFTGNILNGKGLMQSAQNSMDAVKTMIEINKDNEDKFKGIPVENCLEVLK